MNSNFKAAELFELLAILTLNPSANQRKNIENIQQRLNNCDDKFIDEVQHELRSLISEWSKRGEYIAAVIPTSLPKLLTAEEVKPKNIAKLYDIKLAESDSSDFAHLVVHGEEC